MPYEVDGVDRNPYDTKRINPFLKWAGGKRWLIQAGLLNLPKYDRFVEPFLGSAAVFFSTQPRKALLSDLNQELINLYMVMRSSPLRLESILRWHHEKHSSTHYYEIRARVYVDPVWRAARTLYLNRTCWNGLYRVNRHGKFNVPIGTKTIVVPSTENFEIYSKALKGADIRCQDFEVSIDDCSAGDFLFVDPPYTVKHNMNGFVKYNETIFSWSDQVRLASALARAATRGVAIIATNADHETVRELYSSKFTYRRLSRHSIISGKSAHRVSTSEAMFIANIDSRQT